MSIKKSNQYSNSKNWLNQNKALRMDANCELFDKERREFHLSRYEFAKSFCSGKVVLDGACGTGYGSNILAQTAKKVTGIDLAQDAINYANETYANENTCFIQSFVESTPFADSSFDVIISFETVEHTLCPKSHMMEICRLLKEDGTAIVSIPNSWGMTDHHYWDFDINLLKKVASPYFNKIEFFYNNSSNIGNRSKGIGPLTAHSIAQAECIVAICTDLNKEKIKGDRYNQVMSEVYDGVFFRHREMLDTERSKLSYRIKASRSMDMVRKILRRLTRTFKH